MTSGAQSEVREPGVLRGLCGRIAAALADTPQDVLAAAQQELRSRRNTTERTVWVQLALRVLLLTRTADTAPSARIVAPQVPPPEVIPVVPVAEIILPPPPPKKRATPIFSNMALDQAALLLAEMDDEPQPDPTSAQPEAPSPQPQPLAEMPEVMAAPASKPASTKTGASRAKTKPVVDVAAISAGFDALFEADGADGQDPQSQSEATDQKVGPA